MGRELDRLAAGLRRHPDLRLAAEQLLLLAALLMLVAALGRCHGMSKQVEADLVNELRSLPGEIEKALQLDDEIKRLAQRFAETRNSLFLGRGEEYPVALEGALKLKEISYIHAEGYPAAEMKHGPIALIDEHMPVVVIATKKGHYEKVVSNIQEIKSRKGKIIAIVTEGDVQVKELADHVIEVPESSESLSPLLTTIPLQLLSYHIAVMRGCNVDQPRNLAKSVTVE